MDGHILFDKETKTLKHTKSDIVIDNLYYGKIMVPLKEHVTNYKKYTADKNIIKYFEQFNYNPNTIIQNIKDSISKIDNKVPLYDEYTKNLYIIPKQYVHNKVVYESYRFPNKELKDILKGKRDKLKLVVDKIKKDKSLEQNLSQFEKSTLIHYNIIYKKASQIRGYNKLILMLNFLKQFNLSILETTYITVFYFYSNEAGKDITICKRPSFLPHFKHINPYYGRGELINLALNMELIKPDNKYYDQKEIMKLCKLITKNDISADTLMKHQEHITTNDKIGIVRYYSLQGSYFINRYLRDKDPNSYENKILEDIIESMYELVNSAPSFDKDYTLYRFINNDSYLKHLKIGDTYIDPSFVSTTRDPFYGSELYKFGFILIKIKIPAHMVGVGLCIETYSDFPDEQEIILGPFSKLLLDKKDDDAIYYHHDNVKASNITTKYEFTYLGRDNLKLINKITPTLTTIDFLKISSVPTITLNEKIKLFIEKYVNEVFQFNTIINNKEYSMIAEWYDSTNAYKKFYASTNTDGFSLYSIYNDYILFFIELVEENNNTCMYVNYYFSKSNAVSKNIINDADFIDFLAKIAYYFGIMDVYLFASYESCDFERSGQIYKGGTFCMDFYEYLKHKKKRFNNKDIIIDSTELKPKFSYYQLDRLKTLDPMLILNKSDPNEMYQIYTKTYKILVDETKQNLCDFYIWLIENHCVQLNFLVQNMYKIYETGNPFDNDYYVLDPGAYLNNRGLIDNYPLYKKNKNIGIGIGLEVNKNNYRLDMSKRIR